MIQSSNNSPHSLSRGWMRACAQVLTTTLGLHPEALRLHAGQAALDIGCGPGEWVLSLAQRFPGVEVTGIDSSQDAIAFARHLAEVRKLASVQFHVMDARAPLAFPDASFDLIQARWVIGFIPAATWPRLLAECLRLLKPGGYMVGIEADNLGTTTSPSLNQLFRLLMQALHQMGHSFGETSESFGLTVRYPQLMRQAGFSQIQREVFLLDYSFGTSAHPVMVQDLTILFQLVAPMLVPLVDISETDIATLRAHAIEEMNAADFGGELVFHRFCATTTLGA